MSSIRFTNKAIATIADNKIREAIEQGAFDNLAGHGKPIAGLNEPFDDNWWVRNWFKRERLKDVPQPDLKAQARQCYDERKSSRDA